MGNSGITWGKPLVEFGLTGAEDAAPSNFKTMPTAEENTVLLTTCLLYTSDAADE